MDSSVIFQIQSALILTIFYLGLWKRKNRDLHVRLMLSGIIWDLLLILQIEFNRGAINKASQVIKNTWLLNFHVSIAVTTVILYVILVILGKKMLKGNMNHKGLHKKLGMLTIVLRTSTLITSYLIK